MLATALALGCVPECYGIVGSRGSCVPVREIRTPDFDLPSAQMMVEQEPIELKKPAGQADLSGVLLMTPPEWEYAPDGSLPERAAGVEFAFFHADGTLTRLAAVIIEGLESPNQFLSIADGDGYVLYVGIWRTIDGCRYTLSDMLLDSYKGSGPPSHGSIDFCYDPEKTELGNSTFVRADSVFGSRTSELTKRYLAYVCRLLPKTLAAECRSSG